MPIGWLESFARKRTDRNKKKELHDCNSSISNVAGPGYDPGTSGL